MHGLDRQVAGVLEADYFLELVPHGRVVGQGFLRPLDRVETARARDQQGQVLQLGLGDVPGRQGQPQQLAETVSRRSAATVPVVYLRQLDAQHLEHGVHRQAVFDARRVCRAAWIEGDLQVYSFRSSWPEVL